MPRKKRREIKYLSFSQIEALFAVIREPRDRALFRVAYHRGLRASEVGKLRVEDYRMGRERLYVRRLKGSYSGEYPLTAAESKALKAWLRVRGKDPGPLFPSNRGTGIGRAMLHVLMRQYCEEAGIPRDLAHFHSLKHTCATHLAEQHRHLEEVQDHLGHVNVQNTLEYMRLTNHRRDALGDDLKGWGSR
jgi:integrase